MKKRLTSDRWANKMHCKIFKGLRIEGLEREINEWLAVQKYVKILTSKMTGVDDIIIIALFYVEIVQKAQKDLFQEKSYNVE